MSSLKAFAFSVICLGASCLFITLSAATVTCGTSGVNNSCTPSGLQSLINSANHGDTINIAAGVHAWTAMPSGVLINKRITINGGGRYAVSSTHSDTGTWPVRLNTGGAKAFRIDAPAGSGAPRVTGIHFAGNPDFNYGFGDGDYGLFMSTEGSNQAIYRIDNNKFHSSGPHCGIYANSEGLIDHNYFLADQIEGHCIMVQNWGASGNGDEQWAEPTGYGTAGFTFIEDNTFIRPDGFVQFENSVVDSYLGGKVRIQAQLRQKRDDPQSR